VTGVLVVGGGIAGVSTCAELRRRGYDGRITLLEAGELPHDRPPLSKDYLLGKADEAAIALKDEAWYAEQAIDVRLGTRVTVLRPADGGVELASGQLLRASTVVLTIGGRARRLPVPGGDLDAIHLLRTAADARRLRAALAPEARVLVVGAGLIGAEVASTARLLGAEVTLVDPAEPPLEAAVGPVVAAWLHAEHARNGVRVVAAGIERIEDLGGAVRAHLTGGAAPVEADVVVAGVGMVPDTSLAASAGLAVDGGILVDAQHRTGLSTVYAAGDACRVLGPGGTPGPRTEHWEAAQRGGQAVAAALLGQDPPAPSAPWFWTDRHGRHVEVVGEMAAAERTVRRGDPDSGSFAAFGLAGGRCVGAATVDDPKAARAARRLIDRAITLDEARLADQAVNLRSLL
jgi:3-phenylpropionate/trans-cinnamate dioxygenase ferredoxin reductase subunit